MHLLVLEKVMSSNKKRDFAFRGGKYINCLEACNKIQMFLMHKNLWPCSIVKYCHKAFVTSNRMSSK